MRRLVLALAALLVLGIGACQIFWPERLAVNAPVLQMLFGRGIETPEEAALRSRLRTPEGFSVGLFAGDLPNARFLRFTAGGDLLVSTPRSGEIWLLRDADGDGRAETRRPVLSELNRPHGLDLHQGVLYVGETDAVLRVPFDEAAGEATGPGERVVTGLPAGGNHWTRTVRIGPDARLYVSVGSSCNVCIEEDPRRAALLRFRLDGSEPTIFATGLRNTVGFDWRPADGALYGTDNGRDLLGDDFPPCELNRIEEGAFYGWPFANGDRVTDPDLGAGHEAEVATSVPPVHGFRAHTAPLGITFVGDSAPEPLRGAALVALHGSWNRTRKDGYEVVSVHWDETGEITERRFLWGFLEEDEVSGRPVDVAEGPDGAFYVSDDYAGAVYRVAWGPPAEPAETAPMPPASQRTAPVVEGSARAGAALYEAHACFRCHEAERAEAGVVPVPLEEIGSRFDQDALVALLRTPTPPMPVPDLTDAERRDLAAYLLLRRD